MTLRNQLKEHADNSAKNIPKEAKDIMLAGIDKLEKTDIIKNATKKGDIFPDFSLPNAKGELTSLNALLEKGKVVVTFYRGGWCPYCNLALKALQNVVPQIKEKNATLVAVTSETPDNTLSVKEKNELDFEILTSKDNGLARSLGLTYKLPEELADLYKKFGIDLLESQGNKANELPIAATYIIETDKKITYSFITEDYKLRAEPSDIVAAL
ncbi:peroxiredoxin-like family protein [Tenacibaculum sp. 1_MG-2023]|uniref:peroxiredoxin-like family protein n=1 Tax=Tenacibaculum sp. 1_MG-2023 TaxID=3062653 RepID=UPI0026E322AE|nr:peroxiredoxin-like family protein [Tenacibaculum sp. 1_MG-2023]MDO6675512.1 peroxiredoxin-like family protein [Tenacibaculum sp. 1_MG-2023]